MLKTSMLKKAMPLAAVVAGAVPLLGGTWFDAGIERYTAWPVDGANYVVPGVGEWTNTASAFLDDADGKTRLVFCTEEDEVLKLDLLKRESVASKELTVTLNTILETGHELADITQFAKGGLTVYAKDVSEPPAYAVVVKDPVGSTNAWCVLNGGNVPITGEEVTVGISVRSQGSERQVKYTVNGQPVITENGGWAPIVFPDGSDSVLALGYMGYGEIASLAGVTDEAVDLVTLTIPQFDWMAPSLVTANGAVVEPNQDGTYSVEDGSMVEVRFVGAPGKFIDKTAMLFGMNGDMTLPVEGRPQEVDPSELLSINEVMAKNDASLRTRNGGSGLDWIEIRNKADYPIDIAGWYLSDNPDKPTKKKAKIEGSCVVPANGYKVVWADEQYANWAADEAHNQIGLSSGGETLTLSTPDGARVHSVTFGAQIADISVGGEEMLYFLRPTPGAANDPDGKEAPTPKVAFSVPHGYKTEAFELELSCPDKSDAVIYYTLDGTAPGTDKTLYTGPIAIAGTTVVRAAAPNARAIFQYDSSATYLFVTGVVAACAVPYGFPSATPNVHGQISTKVNDQSIKYGMNQDVVAKNRQKIMDGFTNGIDTISLVIDPANLFNSSTGIYVNAVNDGREWERLAVVEMFSPTNPAAGFTVPSGLRIRGGNSRRGGCYKHSFRLYFRSEYGENKLEYPLFGDEGVDKFDKIDLRTAQNNSWSYLKKDSDTFTLIEDVFSRDSQRDMGQSYHRSRYYNLFINGVYWGIYQTEERTDGHHGEYYFGGDSGDWDIVRTSHSDDVIDYKTGVVEGEKAGWENLWNITVNQGYGGAHASNYNRVMGLNPDGTRNPAYPIYLNPTNLAAFMLVTHFTNDQDCPSHWERPNNVVCLRNRFDDDSERGSRVTGWIYHRHDAELSLGVGDYGYSSTDPLMWGTDARHAGMTKLENFNPAELNYKLLDNAEYRMLFADLVFRHCEKENGAMTAAAARRRFKSRMEELGGAIPCESARWGYTDKRTPASWTNACNKCLTFIDNRLPYLLSFYRGRNWYPSTDAKAPRAKNAAGEYLYDGRRNADNAEVYLACESSGTIYYTTNGIDPRCVGGAVSPAATAYAAGSAIAIPEEGASVRARLLTPSGEWSALETVDITIPTAAVRGLRIAEVMSSTADGGGNGSEYIVFTNTLADAKIDLAGVRITCTKTGDGTPSLDITLAGGTVPKGGVTTLTKAENWSDAKITNGKVDIVVYDADGTTIQMAHVEASWYNKACDGTGAGFEALEFGTTVVSSSQWKPHFDASHFISDAVGGADGGNGEVTAWLNGLIEGVDGQKAVAAFVKAGGDATALQTCYLVNVPPVAEPDVVLDICSLSFDAQGRVMVGASLKVGGVEQTAHDVNGRVRMYYSDTLEGLDASTDFVTIESTFPIEGKTLDAVAPARFYRLRIE